MANTTNFGWETPDDTDLVKDGAAAIRTLAGAIDTSLVDLKGGTSGQVLSKNSNTDMDFVWTTSDDANAIQNAIVDAKGDLISATAADTPARLAVGTNGQVLTADSTAATGLKWAPAATGGMTSIATGTLSNQQLSLTSISGAYNSLILVMSNQTAGGNYDIAFRFNGDTGSNYGRALLRVDSANGANGTGIYWDTALYFNSNAVVPGTVASVVVEIPFYALANLRHTGTGRAAFQNAANSRFEMFGGNFVWNDTSAITSITSLATNLTGTYTLYGVK